MKKRNGKFVAILLSLLMVMQTVTPAFAETDIPVTEETVVEAVEAEESVEAESPEAEPETEEEIPETEKAEEEESKETEIEKAEEIIEEADPILVETDEIAGLFELEEVEAEAVIESVEDVVEIEEISADDRSLEAAGSGLLGAGSSLGDLWNENWDTVGSTEANKPAGDGTESSPYIIDSINNLMWLSYHVTKKTTGIDTAWYVLNKNIDYTGCEALYGPWHPIGWYANSGSPNSYKPFKGHFDGQGHTISGIDIIDTTGKNLQNVGLFGVLKDAGIRNLTVEADTVNGYDNVGILAGTAIGHTEIHDVTVSGFANAGISTTGYDTGAKVGGIVGNANGTELTADGSVVIENCTCDNVTLNAKGGQSSVGGMAGFAANAYIVDSRVVTGSYGFQGSGYVGGIAGTQSNTNIYDSYIGGAGAIGGNNGIACGGVTGQFQSGEIIVAQTDAEIGSTNAPTVHEGIIIGTRAGNTTLSFGTNQTDNASYLFYNQELRGAYDLCASGFDTTGAPKSAETGYWTDNELKYTIVEGSKDYPCEDDRFFYEELEAGIKYIITQKLNRKFTAQDYANGLRFKLDHYAPGVNGSPKKGHLLTIPMINAQNSPTDLDVAMFTAVAGDGSIYYKSMNKDSCAAVEAGTIVTIHSSAKNDPENNKFFQRVVDEGVNPEKAKRPTYTDASTGTTKVHDMAYQTGGIYTFTMPDSDSEINIFYEKVLSGIWTVPDATTIHIVETRTGDRKKPEATWTIKDENGKTLCNAVKKTCPEAGVSRSWQFLADTDVTPVSIAIKFNSVSDNNKIKWSVDDETLINLGAAEAPWTDKDAQIEPVVTMDNTWLDEIIAIAEDKQKNANYTTTIPATVYEKTAVLTATTDPDHSINNIPAYAHCDVTFTFQIVDQTSLLTEGVTLDKNALTFTVKRKVTGHRRAPVTTWEVTGEQALKATVTPAEANVRSTEWEYTGDAATAFKALVPTGEYDHDVTLALGFDGADTNTLVDWMKELYEADNAAKAADLNYVMSKSGEKTSTVKVTATDKELKVHEDVCNITLKYETEDLTKDVTDFTLDTDSLVFNVTRNLSGDRINPTEEYIITSPKKITGSLSADAPFLEDVLWTYDSAITLAVTRKLSGNFKEENLIGVNFDPANIEAAPAWIGNVIRADDDKWKEDKKYWKRSASATVSGYVTATANDVTLPDGTAEKAQCLVTINFKTTDETVIHPEGVEMNPVEINKKLVIEKTGDIKSATKSTTGFNAENIKSLVLPNLSFTTEHTPYNRAVKWTVSDEDVIGITQEGLLTINQASRWIQELQSAAPYKGKKTVYVYCTTLDNGKVGATTVNLEFETICVEEEFDAKNVDLKLTATGSRSNPTYTWTGADPFNVTAKTYPDEREIAYTSSDPTAVSIDKNGRVTINPDRNQQWIRDAMAKNPYTAEKIVTLTAKDGSHVDTATVKLAFSYKDSTYSSSGGGGGGISGGGTSVGTGLKKTVTGLPTYVISGTWVQSADGTWRFSSGRTYTAEWACVFNPYASGDQAQFDWFRFDGNSVMVRGWFEDPSDGNKYYLWPLEDGTQGHMCVGCQFIDGAWYYFNEKSDGTRGKLMRSATVTASDGKTIVTDASGRILSVNGNDAEIASLQPTPNTTASLRASGVIGTPVTVGPGTS